MSRKPLRIQAFGAITYAVIFGAVSLAAAVWVITLDRIEHERGLTLEHVQRENDNLALAYEQHTVRTLEAIDQAVNFLRYEHLRQGAGLDLPALFAQQWGQSPLFLYAAIVDARGAVVNSSRRDAPSVHVATRDYFVHHRADLSDVLRIGAPTESRVDGRPAFHATRRVGAADGSFAGVALIAVDPERLADFQRLMDLGPTGVVQLVGMDGVARVRRHGVYTTYGENMRDSQLLALAGDSASGRFTTRGRLDGVSRLQSYRRLEAFPFVVGIGRGRDQALAEFARREQLLYAGTAGGTLTLLLLAAALAFANERQRRGAAEKMRLDAAYRATFDQAAVGMTHTDSEGRFVKVNRRMCELLGYAEAELLGKRFIDITLEEDRPASLAARDRLLRGELEKARLESRKVRKGGEIVWFMLTASVVRDPGGKFEYILSVLQDITERKEAEARLLESEERFRSLTELSSDFYWESDAEHRLVRRGSASGKPSSVRTFEKGRQLGVPRWEVPYLSPDEEGWRRHRADLDEHRPFRQFEITRLGDDGSERFISLSGDPVFDAQGRFRGYRGVGTDITDRKRAELELRESERRFRDMLGTVQLVSMMLDVEARITYCNDYLLKLTGWKREELIGRSWFDIFIPAEAGALHEVFARLLADDPGSWHHENEILTRSGDRRLVRWNNTVLRSASGTVLGTASIGEDVTEQRRAEEALVSSARRVTAHAQAVADVSASTHLVDGDVEGLARLVTERACAATGVARANVWLLDEGATELRCIDLYEALEQRHSAGQRLPESQFRTEFAALKSAPYVNADDPLTDPRTAGYVAGYLKPLGITSMLDAVIQFPDRKLGLLCLEHVGEAHRWTGDEIAFACQLADKLALSLANRERRAAEARFRATFEQSGVGVAHAGLDGRFVSVNAKFAGMLGYRREELVGLGFDAITHPDDRAATLDAARRLRESVEESFVPEYEKRYVRKDASVLWAAVNISLVRDSRGAPDYFIAMVKDISARKAAEDKLEHQAHYDWLTELPNRALFNDRLEQAHTQAKRKQWSMGVLCLDLDRFKALNDTLGAQVGDALLKQTGERLAAAVRPGDTVARLGGDQFGVLLAELAAPADAAIVSRKITAALGQPYRVADHELYLSASVGVATYPQDGEATDLVNRAEAAMFRAKELGRNMVQFYAEGMNERAAERLLLEADLRKALEARQLTLYYQPKVSLVTGGVTGFEALMRWPHPTRGMVSPGQFVPILEETGLIHEAGGWAIDAACAQLRAWRDAGLAPMPVAVNLSARQFLHHGMQAIIEEALRRHGVAPSLLEVEITESDVMRSPQEVSAVLERIRARGCTIAVDDFGTGYSSLAYLKRLPLDTLKIDRSFISGLPGDLEDAAIARAVIAMAHRLGLKVVAEGVETEEQRIFLAINKCDEMQGFLFSKPLPAAQCAALLAQGLGCAA